MPVYGTIASQFNDNGMNQFYIASLNVIEKKFGKTFELNSKIDSNVNSKSKNKSLSIVPQNRTRYLSEIVREIEDYKEFVQEQCEIATKMYQLKGSIEILSQTGQEKAHQVDIYFYKKLGLKENQFTSFGVTELLKQYQLLESKLHPDSKYILENWDKKVSSYKDKNFSYRVRDKEIIVSNYTKSLSDLEIPKISLPKYKDWGDILRWNFQENIPGEFPFTAGVYPFKRSEEDPTRMFAGEGGPERTNKRFHYITKG